MAAIQAEVSTEDDPCVITSFVIVVEYMDASGEIGTITLTDGETPAHRLWGLLTCADVTGEGDYWDDDYDE